MWHDVQQSYFNAIPDKLYIFAFYQEKTSSIKQADFGDVF